MGERTDLLELAFQFERVGAHWEFRHGRQLAVEAYNRAVNASEKADAISKFADYMGTAPEHAVAAEAHEMALSAYKDVQMPRDKERNKAAKGHHAEMAAYHTGEFNRLSGVVTKKYGFPGFRISTTTPGKNVPLSAVDSLELKLAAIQVSTDERKKALSKGLALPDKSFPVNTPELLNHAIQSWGRCPPEKRGALKALLSKAANDLKVGSDVKARISALQA